MLRRREKKLMKKKTDEPLVGEAVRLPPGPAMFIKAIEGSGGLITVVMDRLKYNRNYVSGCLSKKGEAWDKVREALAFERERVGDIAEDTVQYIMGQRLDIGEAGKMARWILERKYAERGFLTKTSVTVEGGDNPLHLQTSVVSIDTLKMPVELRKQLLQSIEEADAKDGDE